MQDNEQSHFPLFEKKTIQLNDYQALRRKTEKLMQDRFLPLLDYLHDKKMLQSARKVLNSAISISTAREFRALSKSELDQLTGVYKKEVLINRLEQMIEFSKSEGGAIVVTFIDLDHFKDINDTKGHVFGDKVLIKFANLLAESVRKYDYIGRMGGDEFAIVQRFPEANDAMEYFSKRLQDLLKENTDDVSNAINVSMGTFIVPNASLWQLNPENCLIQADIALYEAKKSPNIKTDNSRIRHCIKYHGL
jgi:diguanylate cyclase (GGDEF)-like protein